MLSKIDFETLDMDGDKIISLADAKACLDSGSLGLDLKESLNSDHVEAFFAKADSDSSGGLDEDELASAFQQYKTEQLVSRLQARASAPAIVESSLDSCVAHKDYCSSKFKCCSGCHCRGGVIASAIASTVRRTRGAGERDAYDIQINISLYIYILHVVDKQSTWTFSLFPVQ
ncbi:unnamed protein product [Polarella glacialis]|uniref:EF-hand domain-containing protein n=1 Tax=Polarella glacialis TaxID=89957 RepID=A0A813K6J5_POLGL|nr:unnamed protein product [Polarella glacialis]